MLEAVLVFFLGASVGSFVNVVADRLPNGESLVRPPSHCPACGRRLAPLEMVPVLSYVALRGRCRTCHSGIPVRVLGIELLLGLLALHLYTTSVASVGTLLVFAYASLFLLLAAIDLDHGVILDVLVYPAFILGLLMAPWWQDFGLEREFLGNTSRGQVLLGSLAGAIIGAGFFAVVILAYRRGMGWGDVKMAGLIGIIAGVPGTLVALLVSIVSGGLVAAGLLATRRRRRGEAIPFGPFLALGGWVGLLWGGALWHWYFSLFS